MNRMRTAKRAAYWILLGTILHACGPSGEKRDQGIRDIDELKTKQYAIEGQQLYLTYCSNCHQEDGSGLAKLIPPLRSSDYMLSDIGRTIRLIKYGVAGEMTVNGQVYNQAMPGNPGLTPLEIAQLSTYIYNVWGHKKGIVSTEQVNQALENVTSPR
ncbi:Cytochrome c, mono-and diheme variants [Cyclobacterium xiamenense]|uniref:Cytochrome c, mono-and diheme variants n=1 Tax=Cyclobacterium xiamenense TaxID=1297121 RepID=A0A1H6Z7S7_9BACT|nr:cytochrome c [Cyclobacterium xiamenense]SEJ49613.1 Cytochrome c, mono-and diheme variants [Cyclobacterium xiamenense]